MKRVLLKLSGEALAGDKKTGFDEATCIKVAEQVKKLTAENRNFTRNVMIATFNTISLSVKATIRSPPLPSTEGMQSPSTPAAENAIIRRVVSFKNFGLL